MSSWLPPKHKHTPYSYYFVGCKPTRLPPEKPPTHKVSKVSSKYIYSAGPISHFKASYIYFLGRSSRGDPRRKISCHFYTLSTIWSLQFLLFVLLVFRHETWLNAIFIISLYHSFNCCCSISLSCRRCHKTLKGRYYYMLPQLST